MVNLQERLEQDFANIIKFLSPAMGEKARIGVSFIDLKGGGSCNINGEKHGWAASLIKLPVMIEVLKQCKEKKLCLDEKLEVNHHFMLEKDDTVSMMPADRKLSVFELVCYMIIESDNEATNILADKVGIININRTMEELGLKKTRISHLIYRNAPIVYKGVDGKGSNTTCPNDMALLLKMIYKNEILSEEKCALMRTILEYNGRVFSNCNNMLKKYLPEITRIGRKSGLITNDVHECGVINGDYAICIMINRMESYQKIPIGKEIIGRISQWVYALYYGGI